MTYLCHVLSYAFTNSVVLIYLLVKHHPCWCALLSILLSNTYSINKQHGIWITTPLQRIPMGFTFLVINPELPVLLYHGNIHQRGTRHLPKQPHPNLMSLFRTGNSKHLLTYTITELIFIPCKMSSLLWPQALLKGCKHLPGELVATATIHGASIMDQELKMTSFHTFKKNATNISGSATLVRNVGI